MCFTKKKQKRKRDRRIKKIKPSKVYPYEMELPSIDRKEEKKKKKENLSRE
tara:strand:+ start:2225 stop:2377 length:153 start_codon:yes stop_codon:yes gene_type:complete